MGGRELGREGGCWEGREGVGEGRGVGIRREGVGEGGS